MVATENADKVGEFSLTDRRFSRITKFMAETLFDENVGGPFGNTHIALGKSYHDCYAGDPAELTAAEWERLGFNESSVHTDIVSTTDRRVTATLRGGERAGDLRGRAVPFCSDPPRSGAEVEHGLGRADHVILAPSAGMIAVPIAKNSITWLPQPWERSWMSTPTMPSAFASSASACMRSIASSRASYSACV